MTVKSEPGKAVILIVEDHPPTLAALHALITTAIPMSQLLDAESGELAIELCEKHAPQVVVMDIALPGIDGIEATRRIKALQPGTCVLMHSSHDLQVFRDAAAAAGASAFVTKARTFSDLVPVITGLLTPAPLGSNTGR